MNAEVLRSEILSTLASLAPEADLEKLDPSEDIREALDLDSMDILRFATTLHEKLGIDIPEADYSNIVTVDGAVEYLQKCVT